jgi:hypothetical protein
MSMLDDLMRDAGSAGMVHRAVTRKPDADDIVCGYFDTDDVNYGLRMLVSCFEVQKQAQPFKVGDRVRVKKRFWYLGNNKNGWEGFAQMFADATGTVKALDWSPMHERWYLLVEYQHPYRWSDYSQDFNVKDHASSFMFNLEHVKKVKRCD